MGKIITVNFRGDELYGFENDEGVFVALKPIVKAMGLDWSAQFKRVKRDPILSKGIAMMATPWGAGGDQEVLCLKMNRINGWLFTIDSQRITDDDVRAKVILYQEECYEVLHSHFHRASADKPDRIVVEDHEQAHESDNVKLRKITEVRQIFGNRAAGQLWFHFGLEIMPAMIEESRSLTLFDYDRVKTADVAPAKPAAAA